MSARLVLASRCPGGLAGGGGACSKEHARGSSQVAATEKIDKLTVFGGLDGVLKDVVRIKVPSA